MLGKVLDERYKILKELGKGGMAIVYEARDLLLDRKVAIKMLRPEYISDTDFIKKFRHEAKAVARISHPNVVSIFDIARDEQYHYLVMEKIEGQNLKDIIIQRGKLTTTESLDIASQICSALTVAHENNIIHCDIKPHNILIDKEKQVKVTDFGIARAVTSSTITATDTIMGSAHYFSPEQAKGGEIKTYSDLYSVGVVLYEMLTGRVPFDGESPISVALKHIQENPQKPTTINADIPVEVEELVMKALAKEPGERFKDAREMKKAITSVLKSLNRNRENGTRIISTNKDDTKVIKKSDFLRQSKKNDNKNNYNNNNNVKNRPRYSSGEDGDGGRNVYIKKVIIWSAIILLVFAGILAGVSYFYKSYTDVPVVQVPDVVGSTIEEAKSLAEQVGLEIEEENEGVYHSEVEKGKIISQYPRAGERVRQTRKITVTFSKGPRIIQAPDLLNKSLREVKIILGNEDIGLGSIEYEYNNQVARDIVISQSPAPGEELEVNHNIDLVLSQGPRPEMVTMPNLYGLLKNEALDKLNANNLIPGNITEIMTKRFKKGQIAQQQYKPGEEIPKNSQVDLSVSKGLINLENAEVHSSTVGINVQGFSEQEIKILVRDNNGEDVAYQAIHKPGDYVRQTINSVGSTLLRVYIDGELVKEKQIE